MLGISFRDWQSGGRSARETGSFDPPVVSRSGVLGIAIDDLWPGCAVALTRWEIDQYALRLLYEVRPALVEHPHLREMSSLVVIDDLGNEQLSVGGAIGLSSDGSFSDGVESVQLPARSAAYVDVLLERDGTRRRVARIGFSVDKHS